MSEIITAMRAIATQAANEGIMLGTLDGLEDDVVAIAGVVPALRRHNAVTDPAGADLAMRLAREAIDATRDRIVDSNAPTVLDQDLMPLRSIRQGADQVRLAIHFTVRPWEGELVLDIDGVTTPVTARDVMVHQRNGRQFFVVGDRAWAFDDAIAVTDPDSEQQWPAVMMRGRSVVRVRPA